MNITKEYSVQCYLLWTSIRMLNLLNNGKNVSNCFLAFLLFYLPEQESFNSVHLCLAATCSHLTWSRPPFSRWDNRYNTHIAFKHKVKVAFFLIVFLFPGNSIERAACTRWNPSPRWVRPNQSPPRGELSFTGSRMRMEPTSRTSPSTWPRRPTCSYAFGKERATEWMSLELLYFQPPWVKTCIILVWILLDSSSSRIHHRQRKCFCPSF